MFAFSSNRPPLPANLAERARPVAAAASRRLPLADPWDRLLAGPGLRRGATVAVHAAPGAGGLTLALSLLAGLSVAGGWSAVVGVDDPGVVAIHELGVDLRRVLFVARPRGAWAEAAADLLDGVDAVVLRSPSRPAHGAARRLMGRARERGATLVVLSEPAASWPLPADLSLEILVSRWTVTTRLEGRRGLVRVSGRGSQRRPAEHWLALPDLAGRVRAE
jgi:hypothetical protein